MTLTKCSTVQARKMRYRLNNNAFTEWRAELIVPWLLTTERDTANLICTCTGRAYFLTRWALSHASMYASPLFVSREKSLLGQQFLGSYFSGVSGAESKSLSVSGYRPGTDSASPSALVGSKIYWSPTTTSRNRRCRCMAISAPYMVFSVKTPCSPSVCHWQNISAIVIFYVSYDTNYDALVLIVCKACWCMYQ